MKSYSLTHVANHVLLRDLNTDVTNDRNTTAWMLARIAEVDARRLYLPEACSSMFEYCVRVLRMSEDIAYKRIRVARAARQFPDIFEAVADGRLNVSGVVLLAPHLRPETAVELLVAAADKTKAEIEMLMAQRFPRPDVATVVQPIPVPDAGVESAASPLESPEAQLAPGPVVPSDRVNTTVLMEPLGSQEAPLAAACAKLAPLSPGKFALQFTVDQHTHDQLRYAQALLGHAVPSGDVAQVIRRALDALVEKLEQRKFARSARSRPQRSKANGRYVPAAIRRAVWERDGGQCTFVNPSGRRCEGRARLEFDHIDPVARGGETSVAGLRLRCRAHNQYAAECTFGVEFMRGKREEAQTRAAESKARARAHAEAQARAAAEATTCAQAEVAAKAAAEAKREKDVTPWLRQLGFTVQEARRGVTLCAHIPDASIEERVRVALRGLAPASARRAVKATLPPG